MKGYELQDKMELIDPAYVEAADEKPVRKKPSWVKWGAAATCLGAVLLAGAFLLREKGPAKTVTVNIGGVTREYKNNNVGHTLESIEWRWEEMADVERYTSLEWNGKTFATRRSAVSRSLLGDELDTVEVTGSDTYSDEVHRLECEVYEIAGVSPELYVAVGLDGEFYVFHQNEYDPPATLGELLDSCSLPQTLTLVQFTRCDGPEESSRYRQDDDAYLWSVLEDCRDAEFVKAVETDPFWGLDGEYLSFTAESEALGVHNLVFYVTKSGYIQTNIFSYAYMFRIGEEATGQIIDYALSHSEPSQWERLYNGVAGTVTAIEDGYLFIDDSIRCADPEDGMVFRVPLDDVRISRHIGYIGVGDLVSVTFTGDIDVEAGNVVRGAFDLTECWIEEDMVLVPL